MFWQLHFGRFLLTLHRQYPEFGVHFVKHKAKDFGYKGIALSVDIASWGIIFDYSVESDIEL